MQVRDIHLIEQEIRREGGVELAEPARRVAACATLLNPLAGQSGVEDLSELVELSVQAGNLLTERALARIGQDTVRSFGKAVIVGTNGDLEHGAAMIHVRIGLTMRNGLQRGMALIPGNGKSGTAGSPIDMILGGVDDGWDYDAMDTMTIVVPGSPRPDEVLLCVGFATARPNARIAGASQSQVSDLVNSYE